MIGKTFNFYKKLGKEMGNLVMFIFSLIFMEKIYYPQPKEFNSMKNRKSNITSHRITHLKFQILIKISCFSYHFPSLQSNLNLKDRLAKELENDWKTTKFY